MPADALGLPQQETARIDLVLLSLFTAIQAGGFFSASMPSVFTIDHFAGQIRSHRKLKEGIYHAWFLSLGVALLVSVLVRSPLPFVFTLLIASMFTAMYVMAMRDGQENSSYSRRD